MEVIRVEELQSECEHSIVTGVNERWSYIPAWLITASCDIEDATSRSHDSI